MRLHLDSSIPGAPDTAQAAHASNAAGRSGQTGAGLGAGDSISVSGLSSALNQVSAQRSSRIEQLTAAVQAGKYQVSSSALSGAIVGQAVS